MKIKTNININEDGDFSKTAVINIFVTRINNGESAKKKFWERESYKERKEKGNFIY